MRKRRQEWLLLAATVAVTACGRTEPPPTGAHGSDVPAPASSVAKPVEVVPHPDPLAALESADPTLAANKRLVFDLWRSVVDAGHVEMADDFLVEGYVQHSVVDGRLAEHWDAAPKNGAAAAATR
jgi:hypothetical protein